MPIHIMEESTANLPSACGSAPMVSTATKATTRALHANSILGAGLFRNDAQLYFDCPAASLACQFNPLARQRVQNPVGLFSVNNNGMVIQLPTLPSQGASAAQGYLIFGVGTQANNQLDSASVLPVDPYSGYFTTTYQSIALQNSFIDSGSNGLFFNDPVAFSGSCSAGASGFY